MKKFITAIAAIGSNNELGCKNDLIWKIKDDLKRFKNLTHGGAVVMGRKTYESIGRPLPYRINIILTRDPDFTSKQITPDAQVVVVRSVEEALKACDALSNNFIIGGAEIYDLFMEHVDRLEITHIHATAEADTYFPNIDHTVWGVLKEDHKVDEETGLKYTFTSYERRPTHNKTA